MHNKIREASTSSEGIEEATKTQEGIGNPMNQMEEASKGPDSIMEDPWEDLTSIQTVRLRWTDGEH